MFSKADFLSVSQREAFSVFGESDVVAENEEAVWGECGLFYWCSAFFQRVNLLGLRFCFYEGFEACFVCGDAWVRFVAEGFFEDLLPRVYVGSYVVEGFAVDLDVDGWVGWSV